MEFAAVVGKQAKKGYFASPETMRVERQNAENTFFLAKRNRR